MTTKKNQDGNNIQKTTWSSWAHSLKCTQHLTTYKPQMSHEILPAQGYMRLNTPFLQVVYGVYTLCKLGNILHTIQGLPVGKSWQTVVAGKILRSLLPAVHILHKALPLSVSEACEYDGCHTMIMGEATFHMKLRSVISLL